MLKKLLSLVLALAMIAGVLAGCVENKPNTDDPGNQDNPGVSGDTYETPNFNNATINVYMSATNNTDLQNCYATNAIKKTLNLNLVWNELDNFDSQYNPLLAEKKIPDLTVRGSWTDQTVQLGNEGAMINIYDYLDKMPNVKKFLETEIGKAFVRDYATSKDALYCLPMVSESSVANTYAYYYRQDIFEANNMKFPTTQDEFNNTLTKLKTLYPDSYPFVLRTMTGWMMPLSVLAGNYGVYWPMYGWFNTQLTLQNGKYVFAPLTDATKQAAMYVKKLMDDGLLHPSSMSMDTTGWKEAFASNKSFIGLDKLSQLAAVENAGKALNPNFKMNVAPCFALGTNGSDKTRYVNPIAKWWMIGNNKNVETTIKYVDWLYSEEGKTITNWGIEGESYKVDANGVKSLDMDYIKTNCKDLAASGLALIGVTTYVDIKAELSSQDADKQETFLACLAKATMDPQVALTYTGDDQKVMDTYGEAMRGHVLGEISKMIMGQRSFSEWDDLVNTAKKDYKLDDLQKAHENAYNAKLGK